MKIATKLLLLLQFDYSNYSKQKFKDIQKYYLPKQREKNSGNYIVTLLHGCENLFVCKMEFAISALRQAFE